MKVLALLIAYFVAFAAPVSAMSTDDLGEGDILVVLEEFALYTRVDGELYKMPIAIGKPGMEEGIIGRWTITKKAEWPTWTPTQAMLERNCKKYCKWAGGMPGGKHNPLGARALYLGESIYRIHGTNEPSSIGKRASSGCIRMHNDDVTWLADVIEVGATVTVVRYQEYGPADDDDLSDTVWAQSSLIY